MEFLDTQIISYKFKGNKDLFDGNIEGKYISSIVALEFLGIMEKDHGAKMYPIELSLRNLAEFPSKYFRMEKQPLDKEFGKKRTDKLIIDFNREFDSIIIYSNEAISRLINKNFRRTLLFFAQRAFRKADYKKFKQRLDFLLDNNIRVVPVTPSIVERMHQIYEKIKSDYNIKDNYRNSFMDLLIVATAIENHGRLISNDKELNKVLQKCCVDLDTTIISEGIVSISYHDRTYDNRKSNSSKCYVNTQWRTIIERTKIG